MASNDDDSDESVRSKILLDSSSSEEEGHDTKDNSNNGKGNLSGESSFSSSDPTRRRTKRQRAQHRTNTNNRGLSQKLQRLEENTDPFTMASSSSSSSESEDNTRYGYSKPIPDWELLAGRSHGTTSLLRYLAHHEVTSLIGWATHVTHDGTGTTATAQEQPQLKNAPPQQSTINPLLGVQPNGPLPPSHLNWIMERAHEKMAPHRHAKKIKASQWDIPQDGSSNDLVLMERLDHSALVAFGIALEEMMTASLLPLAELHVARCQQLEHTQRQRRKDGPVMTDDEQAFREWTLPPEESIFNMISEVKKVDDTNAKPTSQLLDQKRKECVLPTACPPTRTLVPGPLYTPLNLPQLEPLRQAAVKQWCQAQGRPSSFFRDNMDLFRFLLPTVPDDEPPMVDDGQESS